MILQHNAAPALRCVFDSPRGIAPAVESVLAGLFGRARSLTPKTVDMIGLAATEVLHTVLEHCGRQRTAGGAPVELSLELWVEPELAVLVIGHAGPALPEWLISNWDRGEEPALLDAPGGWGWLLVREALDGVSTGRCGDRRLLFLEKRL